MGLLFDKVGTSLIDDRVIDQKIKSFEVIENKRNDTINNNVNVVITTENGYEILLHGGKDKYLCTPTAFSGNSDNLNDHIGSDLLDIEIKATNPKKLKVYKPGKDAHRIYFVTITTSYRSHSAYCIIHNNSPIQSCEIGCTINKINEII